MAQETTKWCHCLLGKENFLSIYRCPCYDGYLHITIHTVSPIKSAASNQQHYYVEFSFSYVYFHFTRILGTVHTLKTFFHNHSNNSLWRKQTKGNHSSHSQTYYVFPEFMPVHCHIFSYMTCSVPFSFYSFISITLYSNGQWRFSVLSFPSKRFICSKWETHLSCFLLFIFPFYLTSFIFLHFQ
jgi:hypothetical protein